MKDHSVKRLLICLALICGSSGLMQVKIFNKRRNLHYQHYQPQTSQTLNSAPVPMEGVVAAIGSDRIHIRQTTGGGLAPVRCDRPERFVVGQKVSIQVRPGDPPTAVGIETLP